jgi:erythromycin esterase
MKRFLLLVGMIALTGPIPRWAGASGQDAAPAAPDATMKHAIANWIRDEAIPFDLDDSESFNSAVDRLAAALGGEVELLGIGEPLHGGEGFLRLRNRLFQRLVEGHNFSAVAVESCFVRGWLVNDYVNGPGEFAEVKRAGFSHNFGELEANRELAEWMRGYNAVPGRNRPVRFYGFDSPTEMTGADSPRRSLYLVLDYLAAVDPTRADEYRGRIEPLLGADGDWNNLASAFDPGKSIGRSPRARDLRIVTGDLLAELASRRPGLVAESSPERYGQALQFARAARRLLDYHAEMANATADRNSRLLGLRDAIMAENLAWIVERERGRGKVLVFAHNAHLQRGKMTMPFGPETCRWWPAGAQLEIILGGRYAVIGAALGASSANGVGDPEPGSIEAHFADRPGPGLFIPTHRGPSLLPEAAASLPVRSGSRKNPGYFPLTPESFTDFDWLAFLETSLYARGGPVLPEPGEIHPPAAPGREK